MEVVQHCLISSTYVTATSTVNVNPLLTVSHIAQLNLMKGRCWEQFQSNLLPYCSAVTWCHHIEWIRGITAYSLAC